ncbi:MAG: hypothetical protein HRU70_02415 [Phycisphaeraceae bacterium]|nr:MAG: hypothetical protein HRU70_02415 [Phycisphaeraceae bacterium]
MLALTMATMAWVVGACVAAFLGVILYAIAAPSRGPDPQRGVAVGCLMMAAIPAAVLGVVLGVAVAGGHERLVRVLFYVTVIPAAYLLVMLTAIPIVKWRKRRHAHRPEDAEEPTAGGPGSGGAD